MKVPVSRRILLLGMALMLPCYAFTVLNVLFSPWPLYERNRPALLALTALCTAGLLLALRAADSPFFARNERRVLLAAAVLYFLVQLGMAAALRFDPVTDAEQCFTAAGIIADGGVLSDIERPTIYFSRYPHNLGMVYLLAAIFRFFGALGWADRYMQAALVCSLLFTLGLMCAARACRRMGGVAAQTRMLILFASCLPMLYCTSELYTDAFSLAFPMTGVYCLMRLRDSRTPRGRVLWALLFALAAFVGAQIRFTAVIAAIACLIALALERHGRALLGAALALLLCFAVGGAAMDAYTDTQIPRETIEQNELPKLHYIAMGLPIHEDEGYGQYGDGGWLKFSTRIKDPDERRAALRTQVIDRVYYLRYPDRLLNLLSRKNLSTFGTGTFMLNEIIEGDAHEPDNAVKQVIFSQGRCYRAYAHLTTALLLAQMLLACAACVQALRRRCADAAPLFIALVGIFLFLCMWETRGRYFFQYVPVLLCAAAMLDIKTKS